VEQGPFDLGLTESQALQPSEPRPLPKDRELLQSLLQAAHDVRDPFRRLISSMRERWKHLDAHREDREEKLQREHLRLLGEQVRADLAKCRDRGFRSYCRFLPLMDYLGWSDEKVVVLSLILGTFVPAEDDLSEWDCYEDCQWASQLEQAVLKPVEDLYWEIRNRLAPPPAVTPLPDANACVFVVTVNGDSSKVEFGPRLRPNVLTVDYEVAVFLREVHQARGTPVTCQTINAQHGLALRAARIIDKIPDDLRPCFVTKKGAGTYFNWNALTKLCQTLRVE
jgi:hypothetical protein